MAQIVTKGYSEFFYAIPPKRKKLPIYKIKQNWSQHLNKKQPTPFSLSLSLSLSPVQTSVRKKSEEINDGHNNQDVKQSTHEVNINIRPPKPAINFSETHQKLSSLSLPKYSLSFSPKHLLLSLKIPQNPLNLPYASPKHHKNTQIWINKGFLTHLLS